MRREHLSDPLVQWLDFAAHPRRRLHRTCCGEIQTIFRRRNACGAHYEYEARGTSVAAWWGWWDAVLGRHWYRRSDEVQESSKTCRKARSKGGGSIQRVSKVKEASRAKCNKNCTTSERMACLASSVAKATATTAL
eukprot:scaffold64512_cov62-Phaeocystis_antarctica.AAC.3